MNYRNVLKMYIETDLLGGTHNAPIGYHDDLLLSGLVNSLGVMRLVAFVQQQFGIEIPADDVVIEHFQTIDAIAGYIEARQQIA